MWDFSIHLNAGEVKQIIEALEWFDLSVNFSVPTLAIGFDELKSFFRVACCVIIYNFIDKFDIKG